MPIPIQLLQVQITPILSRMDLPAKLLSTTEKMFKAFQHQFRHLRFGYYI
jgi:hypothetical protein